MSKSEMSVSLVVGATGIAGSGMVQYLSTKPGTTLAMSRSTKKYTDSTTISVSADLNDIASLRKALQNHQVEYVYYTAHKTSGTTSITKPVNVAQIRRQVKLLQITLPILKWIPGFTLFLYRFIAKESGALDKDETNLQMLKNLCSVLEEHPVKHFCFVTGAKYYGMHLGGGMYPQYKLPFHPDKTPRAPGPNWYYACEDYLKTRESQFGWSVFRPSFIIGANQFSVYNFGTALIVYAVVCKLSGEPFQFWGDDAALDAIWEISPNDHMARQMYWAAHTSEAQCQAFNSTLGQPFKWRDLWTQLATEFSMEPVFSNSGVSMTKFVHKNQDFWRKSCSQLNLKQTNLADLLVPEFIDKAMAINWDVQFDHSKSMAMGFQFEGTNALAFIMVMTELVNQKIIPDVLLKRNFQPDT